MYLSSDNSHIEVSVCLLTFISRTGCAHGRTQGLSVGSPGDTSRGFRRLWRGAMDWRGRGLIDCVRYLNLINVRGWVVLAALLFSLSGCAERLWASACPTQTGKQAIS